MWIEYTEEVNYANSLLHTTYKADELSLQKGYRPMMKGIVRWFNNGFGYGFIQDSEGKDVFVHYSVIQKAGFKTLEDGQEVAYEVEVGPKGEHATVVVPSIRATAPIVSVNSGE